MATFSKKQTKYSVSNKRLQFNLPSYSKLEEILNAVTHGLGIAFSVFAFIYLIVNCEPNFKSRFSMSVYASTLLVLYTISTLYHAAGVSNFKRKLRKLDHCSIFLLIAGTYTPLCLIYLNTKESNLVLAGVWIAAIIGVILNAIDVNKFSKVSLTCYIAMGWSVVFMVKPVLNFFSNKQLLWLLIGGILYTVGAAIYVVGKKIKYMHSIWHLFVLAGSISHFMIFTA